MKTRKLNQMVFGFIVITVFCFFSCRKGGRCDQAPNVNQSEIVVAFKDKSTGKYLYTEVNPLYNKDSLKVFDPAGNSLVILNMLSSAPDNPSIGIYWLSFGNIYNGQTDQSSFNTELCKNFIVKYKYNEVDTIRACFKSVYTECGSVFQTLKVFHKDLLVGSASSKTGINVTITKE
jgi:hypothetical protein